MRAVWSPQLNNEGSQEGLAGIYKRVGRSPGEWGDSECDSLKERGRSEFRGTSSLCPKRHTRATSEPSVGGTAGRRKVSPDRPGVLSVGPTPGPWIFSRSLNTPSCHISAWAAHSAWEAFLILANSWPSFKAHLKHHPVPRQALPSLWLQSQLAQALGRYQWEKVDMCLSHLAGTESHSPMVPCTSY